MKPPIDVHMLVSCRKVELFETSLLAFKTLRVGFPTARVWVWGNALPLFLVDRVQRACAAAGAVFNNMPPTAHDLWIEQLVMNQHKPFWVCDGDVVFFDEVEWFFDWEDTDLFAGRFEPTWREPWTHSEHVQRLHTALMWFNPVALRTALAGWLHTTIPQVFANAEMPMIRQTFVPRRDDLPLFYDTTAGLWQAGGGTPFTERQNRCFEHLHCAVYADEVAKCEELKDLPQLHAQIVADPARAQGIQKFQNEFYQRQAVPLPGKKKKGKA